MNGRFLSASLVTGGDEDAGVFPVEGSFHPELAGGVPECLGGVGWEVSGACGGRGGDGPSIGRVSYRSEWGYPR